jgi:D-alanyl-D-alanine carboxypeptidase
MAALGMTGTAATPMVTAQSKASKKALTPSERLAMRIDSLLQTQDSLLTVSQLGLQIVNLTTGEIIYSYDARQRMRPASTESCCTVQYLLPTSEGSTSMNTVGQERSPGLVL